MAISKPSSEDAQPRRILREPARAESLPKEVRDLVEQAKKRFRGQGLRRGREAFIDGSSGKLPIATLPSPTWGPCRSKAANCQTRKLR